MGQPEKVGFSFSLWFFSSFYGFELGDGFVNWLR